MFDNYFLFQFYQRKILPNSKHVSHDLVKNVEFTKNPAIKAKTVEFSYIINSNLRKYFLLDDNLLNVVNIVQ